MSSSDPRLTINAGDPATEVFVVGGDYRLAGRGLGQLSQRFPPGLYKVKCQCGSHVDEVLLSLMPGRETLLSNGGHATLAHTPDGLVLTFPPQRFASAVPLEETGRTHEYQVGAARRCSLERHKQLGAGSQLFLFARSWTRAGKAATSNGAAAPGARAAGQPPPFRVSLHDAAGATLVELDRDGVRDFGAEDPWLACNTEVSPGMYRLCFTTRERGMLQSAVYAPPGWQAQVFFLQRLDQGAPASAVPPLASASVLLRPLGAGFDPSSPELRLTELARMGLRNKRAVIPDTVLDQMLHARNPMLGIYGGHLLLLADKPDLTLLRKVVEQLRGMIGAHPDVEALALAAGLAPVSATVFQTPPMLARSWRLVVQGTLDNPELVPSGSLSARVADRLYGEGVWLVWRQDEAARARTLALPTAAAAMDLLGGSPARPRPAPSSKAGLQQVLDQLLRVEPRRLEEPEDLSAIEFALARQLSLRRKAEDAARAGGTAHRRKLVELTSDGLVKALGVPMASLESAARQLLERVEPKH